MDSTEQTLKTKHNIVLSIHKIYSTFIYFSTELYKPAVDCLPHPPQNRYIPGPRNSGIEQNFLADAELSYTGNSYPRSGYWEDFPTFV